MNREPKDIGVLLSAPLVRAFLEGRKTVTRRLQLDKWRKAQPGDRIWFRETHANIAHAGHAPVYVYRADGDTDEVASLPDPSRWTPSLLMPKTAARCWAVIEDIREEPLQDIMATGKEVLAEGVVLRAHHDPLLGKCPISAFDGRCYPDLVSLWANGWNSINKKPGTTWADNPTVARIQFRRIEAPR